MTLGNFHLDHQCGPKFELLIQYTTLLVEFLTHALDEVPYIYSFF